MKVIIRNPHLNGLVLERKRRADALIDRHFPDQADFAQHLALWDATNYKIASGLCQLSSDSLNFLCIKTRTRLALGLVVTAAIGYIASHEPS